MRLHLDCPVSDVVFPQRTRHQIRVRCMVSRPASARFRLDIFNRCAAKGCHDFGIRLPRPVAKLAVFRSQICIRFSVRNLLPFFGWESSILSCCRKAVRVSHPKNGWQINHIRQGALLNPRWRQACPVEPITPHPDLLESDVGKG